MREKVNRRFSCFSRDSRKIGAVEWSVGKLMAIVLLIVVLVLVVYGVSSGGLIPLFERTGGMFDEVLLFFSSWGGGRSDAEVECLEPVRINIVDVGGGVFTKCREYCEVEMELEEDLKFADLESKRFRYNIKDGTMNDGGKKEGEEWYSFDQSFLRLDIDKVNITREIYRVYGVAYEEYFNRHKKSLEDVGSLEIRSEIKIYVRVGDKLYRWMEDVKSWEVCRKEINTVDREYYCDLEGGKWYVRVGDNWDYVGDQGREFGYFSELIKEWDVGDDFWYSADFINLINNETPTLDLMQGVREKNIEDYKDSLRAEFEELLDYDLQDSQFSIYVSDVTSINSPAVSINKLGENYVVKIRISGYLDDIIVGIVAPGEEAAFFNAVKKVTDREWENIVKVNKLYEFLKDKC